MPATLDGATTTVPAASDKGYTLAVADPNRGIVTIYNNTASNLYVLLGSGQVTSSMFTLKLIAQSFLIIDWDYFGAISGVWDPNATGNALVTVLS